MNHYVLGFLFSHDLRQVVLIRKNKPEWQSGKLNGIGGKVEIGEDAYHAMVREFREETGRDSSIDEWRWYAAMRGNHFCVECFCSLGDPSQCKTMESEEVGVFYLSEVTPHRADMVDNVGWLLAAAVDHLVYGKPSFITIHYP